MIALDKVWETQVKEMMPLIEMERCLFIQKEYGRLKGVMGTGYWDKNTQTSLIFHGEIGDDLALIDTKIYDPYDITIEELYWMTKQVKKVERCGTFSYLNFFNMFPEDQRRMELLSKCWNKLTHNHTCTREEQEAVVNGHDAYVDSALNSGVKVIK